MNDSDIVNARYLILTYAARTGNISKTCELFGISRTTYYKWYNRYKQYGVEGLKNMERSKPKMPNKISKYTEKLIIDLVIENPKDGPRRIVYDLKDLDIDISETGVYNVLKRNNLNTVEKRKNFSKKKEYSIQPIKNSSNTIDLEKVENKYPGYLLQMGTSYLGKINNIGKVYIISIIDCFSRFSVAKVYTNKSFRNVKDLLETKLIPIMKAFHIKPENILTNESREYATNWEGGKHKFRKLLSIYDINHLTVLASDKESFKYIRGLNYILYKELFKKIFEENKCYTIKDLQGFLQLYITYYNLERTIDDGKNKGKIPINILIGNNQNIPIPTWFFINSGSFEKI